VYFVLFSSSLVRFYPKMWVLVRFVRFGSIPISNMNALHCIITTADGYISINISYFRHRKCNQRGTEQITEDHTRIGQEKHERTEAMIYHVFDRLPWFWPAAMIFGDCHEFVQ